MYFKEKQEIQFSLMAKNYNKKHIILLIIAAAVSILLSGLIEYWLPEYANMDLHKYRAMAEVSPGLNLEVIQPYVYRIFAPWLAGFLPFHLDANFLLLNISALFFSVYFLYKFLILNFIKSEIAFVLTICFIFNRYFFQFLAWDYFHLSDSISYALLFYSLILLIKKKWILLSIVALFSTITREVGLLIIPTGFAFLIQLNSNKEDYIKFTGVITPSLIAFILLRILITPVGGDDLLTKFVDEGIAYFFTLPAVLKTFIMPFIPFSLIPFFFYKEVIEFFKKNLFLLILFLSVLFTTLFGLDFERLMTPSAPVYYLFIGFVIQKYFKKEKNKISQKLFLNIVMILSILSSFYHLWGILQLQNKDITILSSTIIMIVTLLLFGVLKYQKSFLQKI